MNSQKPHISFTVFDSEIFTKKSLEIFRYQAVNNPIYAEYIGKLGVSIDRVDCLEDIPFLPISFFKTHEVITGNPNHEKIFLSSGTTGIKRSKHLIKDLALYENSFINTFEYFFGNISDYIIVALLPSYLEQQNSSLVYMVDKLIALTHDKRSGFYLDKYDETAAKLQEIEKQKKVLLIGVSYALLDLIDSYPMHLSNTIVMETGGMKGRRKELIKSELHEKLKKGFGVSKIYSEYGMTELLSQAYSLGNGLYQTPPWMKVLIREVEDPFAYEKYGKTGGINIVDLANIYSCSFIATQDLGKIRANGQFEIMGRFDHSDIRGCNLML